MPRQQRPWAVCPCLLHASANCRSALQFAGLLAKVLQTPERWRYQCCILFLMHVLAACSLLCM